MAFLQCLHGGKASKADSEMLCTSSFQSSKKDFSGSFWSNVVLVSMPRPRPSLETGQKQGGYEG